MIQPYITFALLLAIKAFARTFYRIEIGWVAPPPPEPWDHIRLLAILNHTSLYEPLFAGSVPNKLLWRLAEHGVVPAADKTIKRPLVGTFYRLVARHVVPISRQSDHTWQAVLTQIHDPESMLAIMPEGRMKRLNGLDGNGQPMTVRGGIADALQALGGGTMLLAYSGGLHHVQAPGERLPRLFKTLRINFEVIDVADYLQEMTARAGTGSFKATVIGDLEARRDRNCPPDEAVAPAQDRNPRS